MENRAATISGTDDEKLKSELRKGMVLRLLNCTLIFALTAASALLWAMGKTETLGDSSSFAEHAGFYFFVINGIFLLSTFFRRKTRMCRCVSLISGGIASASFLGILIFYAWRDLKLMGDKGLLAGKILLELLNPAYHEGDIVSVRIFLGSLLFVLVLYAVTMSLAVFLGKYEGDELYAEWDGRVVHFLGKANSDAVRKLHHAMQEKRLSRMITGIAFLLFCLSILLDCEVLDRTAPVLLALSLAGSIYFSGKSFVREKKLACPLPIRFSVLRAFVRDRLAKANKKD